MAIKTTLFSSPRSSSINLLRHCSRTSVRVCSSQQKQERPHERNTLLATTVLTFGLCAPAFADVTFTTPSNNAVVSSPVHVEMAVKGMDVRPAADGLIPATGHFHIILDAPQVPEGAAIVFDSTHLHYGKGQTSADIELSKGKHKLNLQFANALHESYGEAFSSTIEVDVE